MSSDLEINQLKKTIKELQKTVNLLNTKIDGARLAFEELNDDLIYETARSEIIQEKVILACELHIEEFLDEVDDRYDELIDADNDEEDVD